MGNPIDIKYGKKNPIDAKYDNPIDKKYKEISLNGPVAPSLLESGLNELLGAEEPKKTNPALYSPAEAALVSGAEDLVAAERRVIRGGILGTAKFAETLGDVLTSPLETTKKIIEAAQGVYQTGKDIVTSDASGYEMLAATGGVAKSLLWDTLVSGFLLKLPSGMAGYELDPLVEGTDIKLNKDGFLAPLSENESVHKIEVGLANFGGAKLGSLIGYATRGKALREVEKLTGVKSWNDVPEVLSSLDNATQMRLVGLMTQAPGFGTNLSVGALEGAAFGIPLGAVEGDTPEERFNNAIHYGFAASVLGGVLKGVVGNQIPKGLDKTIEVNNAVNNYRRLMSLPAKNAAKAAAELAEGVPIDVVTLRNMPFGEARIVTELPSTSVTGEGVSLYSKIKNKISVLISKPKPEITFTLADTDLNRALKEGFEKDIQGLSEGKPGLSIERVNSADIEGALEGTPSTTSHNLVYRGVDGKPLGFLTYYTFSDLPGTAMIGSTAIAKSQGIGAAQAARTFVNHLYEQGFSKIDAGNITTDSKNLIDKLVERVHEQLPKEDLDSFSEHGFVRNQKVSYKGKDYSFVSSSDKNVTLQSLEDGSTVTVPRSQVGYQPKLERVSYDNGAVLTTDLYGNVTKPVEDISTVKLTEAERMIVDINKKKAIETHELESNDLASVLASHGLSVEEMAGGRVRVIDHNTGATLATADNVEKLAEVINNNSAFNIGDNGNGVTLPPHGNIRDLGESPAAKLKVNILERWITNRRIRMSAAIPPMTLFKDLTRRYGSDLHPSAIRLQTALDLRDAKRLPYFGMMAKVQESLKGMGITDRSKLTYAKGTMSPDEIIAGRLPRRMNDNEIAIANVFAERLRPESLRRIADYRLKRNLLMQKKLGISEERLKASLDRYEKTFPEGPLTKSEREYIDILEEKRNIPKEKRTEPFSEFAVQDLLMARLLKTPSRAEYVKSLTPQQHKALTELDALYKALGAEAGIHDVARIFSYIPHFRLHVDQANVRSTSLYSELGRVEKGFVNDITRDMTDFNTDPIDISLRYVNSLFREKYLMSPLDNFRSSVKTMANSIRRNESNVRIRKLALDGLTDYTNDYIKNIHGSLDRSEALAKAATIDMMHQLAPDAARIDVESAYEAFISRWNPFTSNNLLKTVNIATQGVRILAGGRDAFFSSIHSLMVMGPAAYGRGIRNFGKVWRTGRMLEAEGKIPGGIGSTLVESGAQQITRELQEAALGGAPHIIGEGFNALVELGFSLSLQPNVYRKVNAFVYYSQVPHILKKIDELYSGKIDRVKFEKAIELERYEPATIQSFNDALKAGDNQGATTLLFEAMRDRVINKYGKSNSPKFMWNKPGKLAGQLGQWPIWAINSMVDEMARNPKSFVKMLTAFYATTQAMDWAQEQTGFNLKSWAYNPQQAFNRFIGPDWQDHSSPAAQLVKNLAQLIFLGANQEQRDDALNDLMGMYDPNSGVLVPVPLVLRQNFREAMAQMDAGNSGNAAWLLIGGSLDQAENANILERRVLPKISTDFEPMSEGELPTVELNLNDLNDQKDPGVNETQRLIENHVPKIDIEKITRAGFGLAALGMVAKANPAAFKSLGYDIDKLAALGELTGGKKMKFGIELEFATIPRHASAHSSDYNRHINPSPNFRLEGYPRRMTSFIQEGDPANEIVQSWPFEDIAKSDDINFHIKPEAGYGGVELTHGPVELDQLDIEGLRQRLAYLYDRTSAMSVGNSGRPAMHIHVSPIPNVESLPRNAKDFKEEFEQAITEAFALYGGVELTRYTSGSYYQQYGAVQHGSHIRMVRPQITNPFAPKGKETKAVLINLPGEEFTVEYRGIPATYSINTIIDNLIIATKHTKELYKKYGIYKETDASR